jgi:hypothetical protein
MSDQASIPIAGVRDDGGVATRRIGTGHCRVIGGRSRSGWDRRRGSRSRACTSSNMSPEMIASHTRPSCRCQRHRRSLGPPYRGSASTDDRHHGSGDDTRSSRTRPQAPAGTGRRCADRDRYSYAPQDSGHGAEGRLVLRAEIGCLTPTRDRRLRDGLTALVIPDLVEVPDLVEEPSPDTPGGEHPQSRTVGYVRRQQRVVRPVRWRLRCIRVGRGQQGMRVCSTAAQRLRAQVLAQRQPDESVALPRADRLPRF